MSFAQGNNTPTRPRIEPGSPDPESDALTIRPVRPPQDNYGIKFVSTVFHLNSYMVNRLDPYLSLVVRKPDFGVSEQVRDKRGCTVTEDGSRLEILDLGSRRIVLSV